MTSINQMLQQKPKQTEMQQQQITHLMGEQLFE
jgi:hypothetical protein